MMNRVDEALRRAADPSLAAGSVQIADRAVQRLDRSVLQHYPAEERTLPASPAGGEQTGGPSAGRTGHRADVVVSPHVGSAFRSRLVIDGGVPSTSIEQYRRLAATVHHLQAEQGLQRLMVSSAVPREGKTLTIVNLALTLSESYERRVLLIDADLRRPSVHDVFGISNRYGLCHAIQSEPMELRSSRVCQNLWVLPAGTPEGNPMAALASRQMERLLDEAGPSFDWILVDAPPVSLVADAGLLARLTRAVIMVIAAGSTPYALVERAVAELGREHIVGTVLNRVEESQTQWSEYYDDHNVVRGTSAGAAKGSRLAPVRGQKVEPFRS